MKKQPPEIAAWKSLISYNTEALYRIERELAEAGAIGLAAYDILIELEHAPEKRLRLYDLAEACVLTKSGISKIVNTLEKQGYLRRERCSEDKRGFFAVLTEKGAAALRKAWPVYKRSIGEFFTSALSQREIAELGKILHKLRVNLPGNFMETACAS